MLLTSRDMNVYTHLNIADIPDILLVCGARTQRPSPSVLSGATNCSHRQIDGWMDTQQEGQMDR